MKSSISLITILKAKKASKEDLLCPEIAGIL
jgi:hypothetical protein